MNNCNEIPRRDVDHPEHYNHHPKGIECIDVVENFNFNLGNVIKYIWRAGLKGDACTDLRKARWYLQREIERLEQVPSKAVAEPNVAHADAPIAQLQRGMWP